MPSTAFPTRQLVVLSLCRICEPIAFMSIFPYVYYMIASFNITQDEKSISMYAGMVTSAFAFAEFSTALLWGRISDKVGRKPVLLSGLAGTGISMLVLGFAPNLWVALLARALGGMLNGNIGVINTTVAEIITDERHQSRAFSIMPSICSIIGSALGGALANPVHNYPGFFNPDGWFGRFPFLLPNLVCCVVVILSLTVGVLFLEETHEDKKSRRDYGIEFGQWLIGKCPSNYIDEKSALHGEYSALCDSDDDADSNYSSTASSHALSPVLTSRVNLATDETGLPLGQKQVYFTRHVVTIIVCFGLLAFHTISGDQLLPILLSLPKRDTSVKLPFTFMSGFHLDTRTIGFLLSSQGLVQAFVTLLIFPLVSQKLGTLATFRLSAFSYPLLWFLFPYVTVAPEALKLPLLYVCIIWKVFAQAFAYPPMAILLANSAPSKKVLGTLNGTASSAASLARAIGPTLSGMIQSLGLSWGCLGLPWWTSSIVAIMAALLSLTLREGNAQMALYPTGCPGIDDASDRVSTISISSTHEVDRSSLSKH